MYPRLLLVVALVAMALPASARDFHLYEIPLKGPRQVQELDARGLDVVGPSENGGILVSAPVEAVPYLSTWGAPAELYRAAFAVGKDLTGQYAGYHTYAETQTAVQDLETNYPAICDLQSMGTSLEGRDIPVLRITNLATAKMGRPEVLIAGNLHARELMSVEIPLMMAEYLCSNYGVDSYVTQLVDTRDIYIAPMLNPDGHVYVEDNDAGVIPWWQWWRKNRRDNGDGTHGVDLNRNFSYQWGLDDAGSSPSTSSLVYRGPSPFSEPETQALEAFVQSRNISIAFSYHSFGDLLLYPWGYSFDFTVDHELFFTLGQRLTAENQYFAGNPAEGAIYLTNGGSDDWAYGEDVSKYSFICFTPELNTSSEGGFGPADTFIQPTFDENLPMNLRLIDLADEPRRVLGPIAPLMSAPVFSAPDLTVSWSGNDPQDPNPVVSYELEEFFELTTQASDNADAVSPWWGFSGGFSATSSTSYEGTGSFFSGADDDLVSSMTTTAPFIVGPGADTFTARMNYDIESDWDYAYVQVSEDNGLSWVSVAGNITTNTNPNGNNRGNGITGTSSGSWVDAQFPLGAYTGKTVTVRIVYITDGAVINPGLWVDIPGPTPVYSGQRIVNAAQVATTEDIEITTIGNYSYRVRAMDADGDAGRWSNLVTSYVDPITSVDGPVRSYSHVAGNYPNPFNPRTLISFAVGNELGQQSRLVEVEIYDSAGRRVRSLLSESMLPGAYREPWHGDADDGSLVGSGVYFVRLRVDGKNFGSQKMVLLR